MLNGQNVMLSVTFLDQVPIMHHNLLEAAREQEEQHR